MTNGSEQMAPGGMPPEGGAIPPANAAPPQPDNGNGEEETSIRRKAKKRKLLDKFNLNINSLMDIMTILLVFLLKSYSADPVEIKPAPGLSLPFSVSQLKPSEATNVTITLRNILVEDKKVVVLENGSVNQADMQGDYLIQPLLDALADAVEHHKKIAKYSKNTKFEGIVTIVADREVPFNLLTKVMYTAGQATFGKYKFAVIKSGEG